MTELLEGKDGIAVTQDDILVSGGTMTEHDEQLNKLLRVVNDSGLMLNLAKCVWRKSELGHKLGKDGVRPDPEKIKALVNMSVSTNVHELQRVRGMINYLRASRTGGSVVEHWVVTRGVVSSTPARPRLRVLK